MDADHDLAQCSECGGKGTVVQVDYYSPDQMRRDVRPLISDVWCDRCGGHGTVRTGFPEQVSAARVAQEMARQ